MGALADAGLTKDDVDGYFCAGDAPGLGGLSMADYMGLKLRHVDTTETGGSSYVIHVAHAAEAIAAGKCDVALITLAGRPRAEGMATGTAPRSYGATSPDVPFEFPYGPTVVNQYAMAAMRHMHEYGTTSEQLAWIKVAASHHAQHNPHALLRDVVTVADVVDSPDDLRPAPPPRLLRDHRRRRRHRRGQARDRQAPRAAARAAARGGRGGQAPDGRAHRPHVLRRRLVGAGRLRGGGASSPPTSSTRPSTTASPSPC